jgi:hypothetical protein
MQGAFDRSLRICPGTKTEIRLTNIKVKDPLVDDASLFDSRASYHAPLWQIFKDRWLGRWLA